MSQPLLRIKQTTIDCQNPAKLADFYARLLGWSVEYADDSFVRIVPEDSPTGLGFQRNEDYIPPVWPEAPGAQQQMEHLDFYVEDESRMQAAVAHALARGATKAATQYSDGWTVMVDPEGHPFCIDLL